MESSLLLPLHRPRPSLLPRLSLTPTPTSSHHLNLNIHLASHPPIPHKPALPLRCTGTGTGTDTNPDLLPVPPALRTFTALDLASLWIGLVVGIPSYYLAGSLLHLGMSSLQAIATVTLANLLLLPPLILTSFPATRHGLSFPVLARASFGVRGSLVPSLLRSLVACGWFSIESWIGAQAIFLLLPPSLRLSPLARPVPRLACSPLELACFAAFWLVQLSIIVRGIDGIRSLEKFSAPILIILTAALLAWAYAQAGGFGPMISLPSRLDGPQFRALFFPSLTANISFWATVAINIPDFARYAKTQRDQVLGHVGLPLFMGLFTFVGVAVTSATEVIYGEIVSDPIRLLARIGGFPTTLVAILGIGLATVTTNIAANVVAPANALVSLSPRVFTFTRGAVATAVVGVLFQPWRLMKSSESFVYTWLVGYSALLGPIGGVMLADYYLVKGRELDVGSLYSSGKEGRYYYTGGVNVVAMVALVAGMLPVVPGFLKQVGVLSNTRGVFDVVYNNAWFVSFFLSGLVHWVLSAIWAKREDPVKDPSLE